jgi:hypothetical protein
MISSTFSSISSSSCTSTGGATGAWVGWDGVLLQAAKNSRANKAIKNLRWTFKGIPPVNGFILM